MADQINIIDLFNKYEFLFEYFYKQDLLHSRDQNTNLDHILNSTKNLKDSLDNVNFGKISYNDKLLYLFLQYLIKEIEIINSINSSDKLVIFQQKTYLGLDFSQQLFSDLWAQKIITLPYKELNEIITEYETNFGKLNLINYNFNMFQLKSVYLFLNNIIEEFIVMNNKIGRNLTPNEKEHISERIKTITKKISDYKKDLFRKIMIDNNNISNYHLKIIQNILIINEYRSEVDFQLETLNHFKINCFNSLNAIIKSNNPNKSLKTFYSDLTSKKLFSFANKKKIIETEIFNIQNWLSINHFFSTSEFFPITIQKRDKENIDWNHDPEIELIYKDKTIKCIKILLTIDSDRESEEGSPLGEWELKEWVRKKLLPGELFLDKLFPITQKPNYLSIKNEYSHYRWNKLFKFILYKNNYYSEPEEQFLALFAIYYDILLVIGVLDLYKGKNHNIVCKNISNQTGIDLIKCSYDLIKKQTGFSYKFLSMIDNLHLMQIKDITDTNLFPVQRFFDILGKNRNFPFYILKQIYEKFFKITIQEENIEKISSLI